MSRPHLVNPRDVLLDAAEAVILRDGMSNMSIEAVAAEAGISKGGLLHHFPSKDRLVEGMVLRIIAKWKQDYANAVEQQPPGPARHTRAMLNQCASCREEMDDRMRRSSSALFAALMQNPALVKPLHDTYAEILQKVRQDGLPIAVGETVAAALDGLWFHWVTGLVELTDERVGRVRDELNAMIDRHMQAIGTEAPSTPAKRQRGAEIK